MTVGERIKQRRLELGLTQEELALKLGCKSRSSVNKVELSNDLTLKTVRAYASALGVDATYLMGWGEESSKYSHIDTDAFVSLMLEPSNKEFIDILVEMKPAKKKELLNFAKFLNERED